MTKASHAVPTKPQKVLNREISRLEPLTTLKPDPTQISAFKRFFHGTVAASFVAIPEAEGCQKAALQLKGSIKSQGPKLNAANIVGMGVFMAINHVEGNGSVTNDKVTGINAVFIDADGTMELSEIKKLNPHLIVRTSRRKYHAYWLVKNLKPIKFKSVQKSLAAKFGTDPSVCNPGRVMRMPGSIHQKGTPVLARILYEAVDAKPLPIQKLLKQLDVQVDDSSNQDLESRDPSASVSELQSALFAIPDIDDRETWLKVGMGIHHSYPGPDGYQLWENWSKRSKKFNSKDQRKTWDSFTSSGSRTVKTIYKSAKDNGWQAAAEVTTLPTTEFQAVDEFA